MVKVICTRDWGGLHTKRRSLCKRTVNEGFAVEYELCGCIYSVILAQGTKSECKQACGSSYKNLGWRNS